MFGPEDHVFNRFASLARMLPVVPLIGGNTRFQPVFAGDVATAIADAVEGKVAGGKIYELGGPEVKTMRECLELVLATIERRRLLVPVPFPVATPQGARAAVPAESAPHRRSGAPADRRQRRLRGGAKPRAARSPASASTPTSLEAILPSYLYRFRPHGQFDRPRPA